MTAIRILFLAANPVGTSQLRLDEEIRAIDQALRQARFRDKFDIRQHWAVRVSDLQECLLRHEPHIVHFSGHGSRSSEIVLEDRLGEPRPVSVRALTQLFSVLRDNFRCIVLNACYSEQQAAAIARHIDCVVGMSRAIGDRAAISFASSFYRALGYGKDAEVAFQLGCLEIDLHNLSEQETPKLLAERADPRELVFASGTEAQTSQVSGEAAPWVTEPPTRPVQRVVDLAIKVDDVVEIGADVLALKFADNLYGADAAVAVALGKTPSDIRESVPSQGKHALIPSRDRIGAERVLFLNVGYLYDFGYQEIREFAAEVLGILADSGPSTRHLAMTIHGVGYGLDETEALRSQLAGYLDAFDSGHYPSALEHITIVERNQDRARRLRVVLRNAIPGSSVMLTDPTEVVHYPRTVERSPVVSDVGRQSAHKPHVFVAMPFADEMDDIYYGIQAPVNAAGYLCERADLATFTGDILDRIKSRIETAALVIAELTTANPNVFLEVGYAWGRERPTVLLAQDPEELPFDVRNQRCLVYKRIRDLEEALTEELQELNEDTS